jgi:hypothetical protein
VAVMLAGQAHEKEEAKTCFLFSEDHAWMIFFSPGTK